MPLPDEIVQSLPEDIRNNAVIARYNDVPSLVKAHIGLTEYQGRSVALPADDAKPEDIAKWKQDYGPKIDKIYADRLPPAKADDYEFQFEGATPEQIKDDKALGIFRENAHKLGLSKSQAAGLAQVFAKEILPSLVPQQAAVDFVEGDEAINAIMQENFRAEAPQVKEEYIKAVTILSREIPELKDLLHEGVSPYGKKFMSNGDHPGMIKLVRMVARLSGQDFTAGEAGKSQAALDAESEIKDIRTNPNNPKYALYRKNDKETVAYVTDLYKQTTGGR